MALLARATQRRCPGWVNRYWSYAGLIWRMSVIGTPKADTELVGKSARFPTARFELSVFGCRAQIGPRRSENATVISSSSKVDPTRGKHHSERGDSKWASTQCKYSISLQPADGNLFRRGASIFLNHLVAVSLTKIGLLATSRSGTRWSACLKGLPRHTRPVAHSPTNLHGETELWIDEVDARSPRQLSRSDKSKVGRIST